MDAAARTSTTFRRRKSHHCHNRPKHRSTLDGESLDSTASSKQMPSNNPNVDELRRVRADFYEKSLQDRHGETHREMDPYASPTRHSKSRRPSSKIPEITAREVRRDHESRHRSRKEKYKEESEENAGYVYRQVYEIPRDGDDEKPAPRRRASAPRATSRYEAERVRAQEPSLSRRHTERRASSRKEAGVESSRSQRRTKHEAATSRPLISRYQMIDLVLELESHFLMTFSRSASMRDRSATLGSRPPLARSQSTTVKARQSFQPNLALPIISDKMERKVSGARRNERPSILGTIFGVPKVQEAKPEKQ
jgi:hypothetical protein